MSYIDELASDFLAQKRVAIAGLSRHKKDAANVIYDNLQKSGYEVYAVHPEADKIGDIPCYPGLAALPHKADVVIIVTAPRNTISIVRECIELGIERVWMHRGMGSSVSQEAVELCRQNNIQVIDSGCPMMFLKPVDPFHACFRWWFRVSGKFPQKASA